MANELYNVMYTKQYASTLDLLSQATSKLFPRIWDKGKIVGSEAYFNQLEPFEMSFNRARYASTAFTEPEYARRRVTKVAANVAIPLDSLDLVQTLVEPKSELSQNGIFAAGRAKDKVIWNAMFGTAYTGVAGGTSTAFDANMIVGVQEGGSSSDVGLNLAKLVKAKKLMADRNVDFDNPNNALTLVVGPQQEADIMQISTLTSSDFMSRKYLVDGKVSGLLGIQEIIVTSMTPFTNTAATGANVDLSGANVAWSAGGTAIDVDSTSHRACLLFAKSALGFGTWQDVEVKAQERADLNNIWQLWMQMQIGATRLDEDKAVLIACQE